VRLSPHPFLVKMQDCCSAEFHPDDAAWKCTQVSNATPSQRFGRGLQALTVVSAWLGSLGDRLLPSSQGVFAFPLQVVAEVDGEPEERSQNHPINLKGNRQDGQTIKC